MGLFDWRPKPSSPPLQDVVERFIAHVSEALRDLAWRSGTDHGAADYHIDAALEARNLVLGMIAADDRMTRVEVVAFVETFSRFFPTLISISTMPSRLRDEVFMTDAKAAVSGPTETFLLFAAADQRDKTRHAWTYYELAMELLHVTAGLDSHTGHHELDTLEAVRHGMLAVLDERHLRPGAKAVTESGDEEWVDETDDATGADTEVDEEDEAEEPRSVEEVLAELHGLIGLDEVKAEIEQLADVLYISAIREEQGLPIANRSLHLVFTGNPGTGKTTVARLVAEIYRALGALPKGQLVETDRGDLVAGYVGQTAERTKAVFEKARGGVLLIDEAYALARSEDGRDFGKEAIDTLVKLMEDHRHDTAVIVAGYPAEMAHMISSNPGLESRFPTTIHFPDYTDDELVEIFGIFCGKHHYRPDKAAIEAVRECLRSQERDRGFGNARLVRNVFEEALGRQASRLRKVDGRPTKRQLVRLTKSDIPDPASV